MAKPFHELRERLLRAGIAPRHVRRYLSRAHQSFADLRAEEERAGCTPADARIRGAQPPWRDGRARWGDDRAASRSGLVRSGRRGRPSAWPRSPFSLEPTSSRSSFCGLVGNSFSPEQIRRSYRVDGFSMFYFGVGRLIYYGAPILIGWGVVIIAARQRLKCAMAHRWFGPDRMDRRRDPGARESQRRPRRNPTYRHTLLHWPFHACPGDSLAHGVAASHLAIAEDSGSFRLVITPRPSLPRRHSPRDDRSGHRRRLLLSKSGSFRERLL